MGVTGLWETIKSSGRPVSAASLRNKILAVDVSLWMHQAVNGVHERHSISTTDAHLMVLFNRICSFLKHGIKPIFVFDGTPPNVKLRVLQSRWRTQEPCSDGTSSSQQYPSNSQSSQMSTGNSRTIRTGKKSIFAIIEEDSDFEFSQRPNEQPNNVHVDREERTEGGGRIRRLKTPLACSTLGVQAASPKRDVDCRTESKKDVGIFPLSTRKLKIDSVVRKHEDFDNQTHYFSESSLRDEVKVRLQPRRSYKSGISDEKNLIIKDEEDDFEIHSSVESRGTVAFDTPPSDDEVQFISCSVALTKPKKKNLPHRKKNLKSKKTEDFLEITAVNLRKNLQKGAGNFEISRGFRLAPTTSSLPTKPTKLFPVFMSSRNAAQNPKSNISSVSSEKRKKNASKFASPAKCKIVEFEVADVTAESKICEKNQPEFAVFDDSNRNLSDGWESGEEKETEKTFTEEEMTEEFWRTLYSPEKEMFSLDAQQFDFPLDSDLPFDRDLLHESWNDQIPNSQQDFFAGSQSSQGPTRQKNGPSVPLPENLKENYQNLMNLFGMPFVESPGEAEAECAFLELSGVTEGTISDDGDVLLFGGRRVYRHFFKKKEPVEFDLTTISHQLQLDRDKLIAFALLTGSDYSDGINGVGPVRALEILAEFGGQGVESLLNFSDWWKTEQRFFNEEKDFFPNRKLTKFRKSFLKHEIPVGFPSEEIVDAYVNPEIDTRRRNFRWGKPNFEILRQFAEKRFFWDQKKIDKIFLPRIKSFGMQLRMDQFFKVDAKAPPPLQLSQRMGKAVKKMSTRGKNKN